MFRPCQVLVVQPYLLCFPNILIPSLEMAQDCVWLSNFLRMSGQEKVAALKQCISLSSASLSSISAATVGPGSQARCEFMYTLNWTLIFITFPPLSLWAVAVTE